MLDFQQMKVGTMSDRTRLLAGQPVLVTGAPGGIGAAIVEQLATEGARPEFHFSRIGQGAQQLLDLIGGKGSIAPGS
ncbi:hypothetical protein ACIP1G_04360 [Pseudomonas sp. NPDC089392]|uniref:hypothetical protein n=1 Tax=Pseudomonas sp. NPDC089392 TaxID=3364459 RepID=UPI003826CFFE